MNWNKAKDMLLIALVALAVRIMHGSLDELTRSVNDLNVKLSAYITKTDMNSTEIERLRNRMNVSDTRLNEVEIQLYRHHPKE